VGSSHRKELLLESPPSKAQNQINLELSTKQRHSVIVHRKPKEVYLTCMFTNLFKRGFAVSLISVSLVFLLEILWMLIDSTFMSELAVGQRVVLILIGVGVMGLAGILLGLLESLILVGLLHLDEHLVAPGLRKAVIALAMIGLLTPVALLIVAPTGGVLVDLLWLWFPVFASAGLFVTHKIWGYLTIPIIDRPLLFLATVTFSLFLVFGLINDHLVVERLHSEQHSNLALLYFLGLIVACFGLTGGLYWVSRRKIAGLTRGRGNRNLLSAAFGFFGAGAVCCGIYGFDRLYLAGLYPEFHMFMKVVLYVAAQVSVLLAGRIIVTIFPACRYRRWKVPGWIKIVFATSLFCAIIFALFAFERSVQVSTAIMSKTTVMAAVIEKERAVLDLDRDGYCALLGGGDCDDLNPRINPGRYEVVDNGVDDNCFGGDLSSERLRRRAVILRKQRQEISLWWSDHHENRHLRYNVILITVDALRADHVGAWGYGRQTTPRIDALANRSWRFARAYCQGGWTSLSLPALLKGLDPSEITFTNVYEDSRLRLWFPGEVPSDAKILKMFTVPASDKNESIAQILHRADYRTVAILNDGFTSYFQEKFGFIQGFDSYYQNNRQSKYYHMNARLVTDMAIRELKKMPADRPFFMWLHHFDPHLPYYNTKFNKWGFSSMDLYDGEIAFTDKYIGDLLDELKRSGFEENTIVIVTADHGEAFFEHGTNFHGVSGYQEQIHVPLIIHVPGFEAVEIQENAALIDILPTVLDLINLRTDHSFSGRSLLPLVFGGVEKSPREVISMTWRYSLSGVRDTSIKTLLVGDHKLIHDEIGLHWMMFNLKEDPGERVNLVDVQPDEFKRLRHALMLHTERDHVF